jgi:diguanylate cyclase (GGDEF)-like protein
MFIDLDGFKGVNDLFGHEKGDLLLQQVATRLSDCVRDTDLVARLGGDEFVVLLEELSEDSDEAASQVKLIGNKILASVDQPYDLAGQEHRSTCSIGVTLFGKHRNDIAELLKRSDLAMYQAKASGCNALRFYDVRISAQA